MEIGHRAEVFEEIRRTVRARCHETVSLLQNLVRVPSPSGEEGAVQEVIEHALSGCGFAVERCEATTEQPLTITSALLRRASSSPGDTLLSSSSR